jgi:hypothetical protein
MNWYVAVTCSALLLVYLNHSAMRWALQLGENALRRRMEA